MAKQRISNYVFLPGVAKSSNAYPNAYTLLQQNKNFIRAEAIEHLQTQITTDNASNLATNAVTLLTNNKTFLIDEIIAWITVRYTRTVTATATTGFITVSSAHFYSVGDPVVFASSVGGLSSGTTYYVSEIGAGGSPTTFKVTATKGSSTNVTLTNTSGQSVQVSYTYSETSCRRDSGYLIDAIIYDVRYGGNEKTIDIAKNFWQGGVLQLYTPAIEIAGFNQIFTIITTNILPKVSYSSQQSPVTSTQNTTGSNAEADVATNITTNLKPIIQNAINGGLSTLPAISYSTRNFAGYIYDEVKCQRDIGLILDAYANDLRYGGNLETRYISSRFWKGTEPQLSGDRRPEITIQTWIRDFIVNTIFTQNSYSPYQGVITQYLNGSITYESIAATRITTLSTDFINVLTNGLTSLPTLQNGVTTVRLLGKYNLDTLLLITNTTHNQILYSFADNSAPATVTISDGFVSNNYWQDDDFPSFRNTADYITTIVFDADTSTQSSTDDVQIFYEAKETKVRPYDFGTDAIERHRVAQPQSMLDADFEYGLQPTKWQAIGLSRGYPSVYEVPGTDTSVSNVITDASTGTGGVGESLITVTTSGPHGFVAGQPFTIKSLANSISGFSRAEGTFITNTVPTTTTFTYYAQSKVGTTNGQVLATTYTQLRKAAFYTGASIGQSTFSVYSNGSSGTFTSKWSTTSGSDQIAFTGSAPGIGSPLTGTGIGSGAQITGVVGTGGLAVTATIETVVDIGDTTIEVKTSSGLLEGMAIDNGSGTSIFVSGIVGNSVTFTGPVTTGRVGDTQTYSNISGTNIQPVGVGLTVSVEVLTNSYNTVTITAAGSGYRTGDRVLITGDLLGGTTPTNDLILRVTSLTGSGVNTVAIDGIATGPNTTYTLLSPSNIAAIGTGATFNITRSNGVYSVTINQNGSDYFIAEQITIPGTSLGGTNPTNNAIITITSVASGGVNIATISGTARQGDSLELWSALSFSELTTTTIADATSFTVSAIGTIQITFANAHGLVPGASIICDISSSGTNHELAKGPFYVEQVPTATTLRYTARAAGNIDTSVSLTGTIYSRPDSYFIHRPYDGGVQLGTGGPQHGAQAIRMSKKYIRYQSGKGINYCTGALFAPSFAIQSISATGTATGSYITIVMDDVDHGCQVGGVIEVHGIETKGYNNEYVVTDIINERQLRVQAVSVLANVTGTLSINAIISVKRWHGATVRAGTFDEQNGLYFYYDGQDFGVGRRSATFQIAGAIDITRDTNVVTGTNTRFRDQLRSGDRIVIKGMTHIVTSVTSQTSLTVNPDYRGASSAVQAKMCLVQDFKIPQSQFNLDKLDGTGPSGYNVDVTKMQMIGMQWSWYAVGFIDFMLRGSDGNFVFFHRIRNSNVNVEAYMRTGNQPVRYEVINESARDKLLNSITASQSTIPLSDASEFPNESGIVMIDNELIAYTGKSGNTLTGCTRAAPMTNFIGGSQRTFTGATASTHEYNTGVVLVSNTISPIISHWGSAMLTDGNFDTDRGYIFNYAATNVSVTTTKQTAFLIRLAPSVSNAIVGDLGDRELLNRAQLLLTGIEITADSGTGGIVVEGVLNPQNYPNDPGLINWAGLQSAAQGGQPSFAQIAPGGSVTWSGGATQTTTPVTTVSFPTGNITARYAFSPGSIRNGINWFYITLADYNSYVSQGLAVGNVVSGTGIPSNTTITSIFNYGTITPVGGSGGTGVYYRIEMSASATQNTAADLVLTVTRRYAVANTSTIFFQKAGWESAGAKTGTEVSDALFPANSFVSSATLTSYFGTQFYLVTFSQTSTSTSITPGTTTITFKFGQPPFALPGETIFSFIASPGTNSSLDLTELKELTNTTLGGRGSYPNGPDVLAVNVYKAAGAAVACNLVIRWSEAQA